ncbi:hypothetical protein SETIT_6G201900v2 [Setaria italica]|uniref:KIB1-4 beta-propeller domain-containing protein n=1 Tax=Setaria italica TaxID=4555 RepID=A0A368RNX0_SETIT|nr:hypothetical protein SETIT_6G201900v2 [Setaria italica]
MTTQCSTFRRLTRSDAAGKVSPDWASLDGDLVELIGWRVLAAGDLQDYVRFRAVCHHWSASTAAPSGVWHQRWVIERSFELQVCRKPPSLMVSIKPATLYSEQEKSMQTVRGFVRFFNLSTGAFARAHLPLLDGHVVLDSVDGLLLLHRDSDTAVRLLHPFTGDVAELPPLASLLPQMEPSEQSKRSRLMAVCTSIAVSSTGAVTVMLAFNLLHRKLYALQFTSVDIHKVYIYQLNPPCPDADEGPSRLPLPEKIAECPMDKFLYTLSFVECGSELLLVAYNDVSRSKLVVYRLADLVSGKIEPITSIGDHTLFVSERSLCVSNSPNNGSKSFPSISLSPNCIICLHSLPPVDPGSVGLARFEQYDLAFRDYFEELT